MPRAEQRLADVDVAEPRHDPLVQQRRLDRRVAALAAAPRGRFRRSRCRAAPARGRPAADALGRRRSAQVHRAEAAGVVEGDRARRRPCAARHGHASAGAGWSWWNCAQQRARDQHPPRHAQMDSSVSPDVEVGQDVFRPPPQRGRPAARSAGRPSGRAGASAGRGGCTSARAMTAPSITGRKPAADGLDLGQFGHWAPPGTGRGGIATAAATRPIRRAQYPSRNGKAR